MRALRNRDALGLGAGVTIGVLLSEQLWLVFVLGLGCGLLLAGGLQLGRRLLSAFEAWQQTSRRPRRTPKWLRDADPPRGQSEEVPF